MSDSLPAVILGGGVTGLAAGLASGFPVLEREAFPGGICSSYYMRAGSARRESAAEAGGDGYRFEHGGGHWIFGGHPDVLSLIGELAPCERFVRRSAVYFPDEHRFVGFPIQHHLYQLESDVARAALSEIRASQGSDDAPTMSAWLEARFGPTLCERFFAPFHAAYTAGLWRTIAPQDGYKTPVDLAQVERGAAGPTNHAAGYNVTFAYPREGLDALMHRLAARVDWRAMHAVERIDVGRRELALADGRTLRYGALLSTLPLDRTLALCGLQTDAAPDPCTSVLVLNIGAHRGPRHPQEHWLYIPRSQSGFHRVGFYGNVAEHFLPRAARGGERATCLYVERSYVGGTRVADDEIARLAAQTVRELQDWGFIGEVDVVDPTWIDVAYTWSRPGSTWVRDATMTLAAHGIRLAGRYARWHFQGIADSLRDGLLAGHALRMAA
ncbi:MAG: protoporphyrinogen/coproporphyrinogen oxidase [Rudaea sp.]